MALQRYRVSDDWAAAQAYSVSGEAVNIPAVMIVDGSGNEIISGGTAVGASSGNVANASAAAALAATSGKTNYVSGIEITFSGATAASVVVATLAGLLGGTQSFIVSVPAGATVGGTPIAIRFDPPHPASAANTAITLTLPALGSGNTNASVNIRGIQK